jgi:hypothetical protein
MSRLFYFIVPALVALPARAEDAPKALLPAEAVWAMRYDARLDGEVTGKSADAVRWAFAVRNDRVSGGLAGLKPGDPTDHRIAGEVVPGGPPIVLLRQDGPKGLVCFYTGKRVEEGRVVGTWFDNRGKAGDFEMVVEAK